MHLVGASRKSMSTLQLARMPERGRRAGWSVHSCRARGPMSAFKANRIGAETISRFIDATNLLLILWVFAPTLSSYHGCCIYRKSYPN
jgi:hypothetical protein